MANTLTRLIPDVYAALDVVGRELSGMIPAVARDSRADRVAKGQDVVVPISPESTANDNTPGATPPDNGDQTFGNVTLTIQKDRSVPFRWNGDEQRGVNNGGPTYAALRQMQIVQAIRTLVNEIEVDLTALYYAASRAFGTAGTAPFSTTIKDLASARKILVDNGCPTSDLQLVMNTDAGVNFRGLPNLVKVNEAGSNTLLRQGILSEPLYGIMPRESAYVVQHTKGTGASYQLNGVHALKAKTINVDTGTGTVKAGDILTIANGTPADANKYVVGTALSAGALAIGGPGLRSAHVDNDAVTVGDSYAANMLFHRSAIVLATRAPAMPEEGDSAADSQIITDPWTGLSFELRMYREYKRVRYEIGIAWGVKAIKSEHIALLLG